MRIPRNPYIAGNPVGGENAFVGRGDVLRTVTRVLEAPAENAIVLYGQRRIGKTSILQQLDSQLFRADAYHPVYFDLQDKAAWSLSEVLHALAREIAYTLKHPDPETGFTREDAFRTQFIPKILKALPPEKSLVFLFDEFDVLDNPQQERVDLAATQFFPYLRILMAMDRRRLKFVFVIGRKPEDLTNLTLSVFKGVKSKRVSLLKRGDAIHLIRLAEQNGTLKWTDEAVEEIWRLTNGHPFLTQSLCQIIWNRAYDDDPEAPPLVTPAHVSLAIPETLESSMNALEWLWQGLSPAEKYVASVLAQAGPQPIDQSRLEALLEESGVRILIRELQNAPRILQEWDILEQSKTGYRFRVELLRQWIAGKKDPAEVQQELDRINPLAENLYQAGRGFYQSGQLESAENLLQQALNANPNHLQAGLLLAEIYLVQNALPKAVDLLETIYNYNPGAARPRLVQVLLQKAEAEENEEAKLKIYDHILEIAPNHSEALENRNAILKRKNHSATQDSSTLNGAMLHNTQLRSENDNTFIPQDYEAIQDCIAKEIPCLIVGVPQMGKSQILGYIEDLFYERVSSCQVFNIDLPSLHLKQAEDFWEFVGEYLFFDKTDAKKQFSDINEYIEESSEQFVFLLDEVDKIFTANETRVRSIFQGLKILQKKVFIVATSFRTRELLLERIDANKQTASIVNDVFGREIILKPWSDKDISKYLQMQNVNRDFLENVVIEWSGGIPAFVTRITELTNEIIHQQWTGEAEQRQGKETEHDNAKKGSLTEIYKEVIRDGSLFDGFWLSLLEQHKISLALAVTQKKLSSLRAKEMERIIQTRFLDDMASAQEFGLLSRDNIVQSTLLFDWLDCFLFSNADYEIVASFSEGTHPNVIFKTLIQNLLGKNEQDANILAKYLEDLGTDKKITLTEQRKGLKQARFNRFFQRLTGFTIIAIAIYGLLRLLGIV